MNNWYEFVWPLACYSVGLATSLVLCRRKRQPEPEPEKFSLDLSSCVRDLRLLREGTYGNKKINVHADKDFMCAQSELKDAIQEFIKEWFPPDNAEHVSVFITERRGYIARVSIHITD